MSNKLEKLKKLMEVIKDDTITPAQLKGFLEMVLSTIKTSKENLESISQKNIKELTDALKYIEQRHKDTSSEIKEIKSKTVSDFEVSINEAKSIIKELKSIKLKDGYTPIKGKDYFDGEKGNDGSPDKAEDIVNKLESLKDNNRLDASAIKNLGKYLKIKSGIKPNGGGWRNLFQLHDVTITDPQVDDVLKFDGENWVNGTGGGGGGTLNATSLLSDTTAKSLYQMTSTIPVEFRASDATSILTIDETGKHVDIRNLRLTGNTISSTDTNGNINLTPNGTGTTITTKLLVGSTPVAQRILSVVNTSGSNPALEIESNNRTLRVTANLPYIEFYDASPYSRLGFFGYGVSANDFLIGNDINGKIQFSTNGYLNVRANINDSGMYIGGDGTPLAQLHVVDTTEQLRLGYDASNYTAFTVSSAGNLTINPTGTDVLIKSNKNLIPTGHLTSAGTLGKSGAYWKALFANQFEIYNNGTNTFRADGSGSWTVGATRLTVASGGNVGIGTAAASAVLDVNSTTSGILFPRMTATQGSAVTGINGMVIYVTDTNGTFTSVGFWGYEAGAWVKL